MSAAFLVALAADFDVYGKDAVVKVREADPAAYLRVVASLVPKELEISRPLDGISDEMLAKVIAAVEAELGREDVAEAPATVN